MNLSLLVGDPIFGRVHDGGDAEELEFSLFICDSIGRMLDTLNGEELPASLLTVVQTGGDKGRDDTMLDSISLLLAGSTNFLPSGLDDEIRSFVVS
jgi:hypothetical protein